MDKLAFDFLKNYSFDTSKIDRLLVSSFLQVNKLKVVHNQLLKSYVINIFDEDYQGLNDFAPLVPKMTFEDLIEIFEFVISPVDKLVTGAVYTPKPVRDYIVNETLAKFPNLKFVKICDPACGCSGFLYTTARKIHERTSKSYKQIFEQNLYGIDIQQYSITRSKILLSLLALFFGEDESQIEFNLYSGNSLEFDWSARIQQYNGFQIMIGNPPYVSSKNIDKENKLLLRRWSVTSTGHPDLYIPFFQLGIENLATNGVLGYITMNTFFKSLNGRAIREYLANSSWDLTILDFGGYQVFKSRNTYTCIFILQKKKVQYLRYGRLSSLSLDNIQTPYPINYDILKNQAGWNLSNYLILEKIEKIGRPFGNVYKTRNGIATLKNDVYIFTPVREDARYYHFIKNGRNIQIEREVCKDIVNPNKLTKLDEIDSIRRKIIFPYEYALDGVAIIIAEQAFLERYPFAYAYLSDNATLLAGRDKGEGNYEAWYAYGRRQSFERTPFKLFFPHITPTTPFFVLNDDPNLLFHNGLAIVSNNQEDLMIAEKILKSRLFWFYIVNGSKPYSSGYFSLSRNYIKNFGMYPFNKAQRVYILQEKNIEALDRFLEELYGIVLPI